MTKSKQIKELKSRLNALENRVEALVSALTTNQKATDEKITYEEVINEWLCGKVIN